MRQHEDFHAHDLKLPDELASTMPPKKPRQPGNWLLRNRTAAERALQSVSTVIMTDGSFHG